jgi:hypothetical protein
MGLRAKIYYVSAVTAIGGNLNLSQNRRRVHLLYGVPEKNEADFVLLEATKES